VLVSDCGTNLTSQLSQEMLFRLACSPRFNTPGHPEASGLVERFNRTYKNMLYHVVQQHGRQWHKIMPLMTWAIREVPKLDDVRVPVHASVRMRASWSARRAEGVLDW